jgi:hypothetical protein
MAGDDDVVAAAATKEVEDDAAKAAEAASCTEEVRQAEEARLRTATLDEYKKAHEALWAQATAVINVKVLIPIILDKATNTYTKWRGIFLIVLGKYALARHVLKDEAFPTRPA